MMRPSVRRLAPAIAAVALSGVATTTSRANHFPGPCTQKKACAGHEYWPKMTPADVFRADRFGGGVLRGRPDRTDELLGWHGSDTLLGESGDDVLWGDHDNRGKVPTTQVDKLYGGDGDDFLYSSVGRNTLSGGAGNDAIKARYGRGTLDCGPGRDIVHLPKSRLRNWTIKNCEKFEYRSESAVGHGLKTLP